MRNASAKRKVLRYKICKFISSSRAEAERRGSKERDGETAAIKNAIMEKQRKRQSAKKWPKSATCGAGKGVLPREGQGERGCWLGAANYFRRRSCLCVCVWGRFHSLSRA